MDNTNPLLDAVMQLITEITEIALLAAFLAVGLIINMSALQSIWMMGATYLVSLIFVAAVYLILVMRQEPGTTH
ncbi:MAG: hypothetical protein KDE09_00210 [Anaerolineales bacterium]|nr:hypothetical protein [Anaerolineales bacterium]MCB0026587.1 hypothetical protein [Anaerolineales bacterium]